MHFYLFILYKINQSLWFCCVKTLKHSKCAMTSYSAVFLKSPFSNIQYNLTKVKLLVVEDKAPRIYIF